MATNNLKVLAGVGAGGTSGGSLAWFAPADTPGPVAVAYTAEVQTITLTGTGTAGTWYITVPGYGTTSSLTYNVATAALATALSTVVGGTVTVTGTAGTSYIVTFPTIMGNVPAMTFVNGITGVTAISTAETTPGAGATPGTAVIPATFKDAGWCSQDGLVAKVNESSTEIKAFGNLNPLRIIITESKRDFDVTFQETNQTSVAVYNRQPIGSIVPDGTGYFTQSIGAVSLPLYAGIFDVVDGINHARFYCPRLFVSNIGDLSIKAGEAVNYPVTFTALPDANGNSVYQYWVVNALIGTGNG